MAPWFHPAQSYRAFIRLVKRDPDLVFLTGLGRASVLTSAVEDNVFVHVFGAGWSAQVWRAQGQLHFRPISPTRRSRRRDGRSVSTSNPKWESLT